MIYNENFLILCKVISFVGLFIGFFWWWAVKTPAEKRLPMCLMVVAICMLATTYYMSFRNDASYCGTPDTESAFACPSCGEEVSTTYCGYCGFAIENVKMMLCPNCREECNTPYCGSCGTQVEQEE